MSKNKPKNNQRPNRSAGGLILPPSAQIVPVAPEPYPTGGVLCQVPADPSVMLQLQPAVLQDPTNLLGFLASLLNQSNALVREVSRLRENAGLPEWTGDLGQYPDGKPEDDDGEDEGEEKTEESKIA